jgi:hypothetical protein
MLTDGFTIQVKERPIDGSTAWGLNQYIHLGNDGIMRSNINGVVRTKFRPTRL